MLPTYHNMHPVLLDKHSRSYKVGDVIAFQCDGFSSVLVKRLVATSGDSVQIIDGTLYINNLPSSCYENEIFSYAGIIEEAFILGKNQWFVIGDNVEESKDSRYEAVGIILTNSIIGKVIELEK